MRHKIFQINKHKSCTFFETNFFQLMVNKNRSLRPMITFTNGDEAAAVFIDRNEAADILRRKFKNNVDRRIQRSETVRG